MSEEKKMKVVKDITPGYIRGFFDGEGSVDYKNKVLILTNYEKNIMRVISKTLNKWDIRNKLKLQNNIVYRIFITGYENIRKYYNVIGTFHLEKDKKFIKLLKSYKHIPLDRSDKRKIKTLKKSCLSSRDIAKQYNCSHQTICNIWSKQ